MPPTNQTALTALDLGSTLPINNTQSDINDAGVNYTVWYKFTVPASITYQTAMFSIWCNSEHYGGGAAYVPTATIFDGPAGAPVLISGPTGNNTPFQVILTPGTEYFIKCLKNVDTAGPEHIITQIELGPWQDAVTRGSILINDDGLPVNGNFPLSVISGSVDNQIFKYVKDFAEGEAGDILDNGISLWEDTSTDNVILYSLSFAQITTIAAGPGANRPRIRTCRGTQHFCLCDLGAPARVRTISDAGVVLATYSPNVSIPAAAAYANDESYIYICDNSVAAAVQRFNTSTLVFDSDLAAGIANYFIVDILVLADDTILVNYDEFASPTGNAQAKRYSAAGAVLNTYNFGTVDFTDTATRLAYALDDPTSFWVLIAPAEGSIEFQNIRISDGAVLSSASYKTFSSGEYNDPPSAAPERFGTSPSCPFMIMTVSSGPGLYVLVPNKRNDLGEAIPTPTFKTALMP